MCRAHSSKVLVIAAKGSEWQEIEKQDAPTLLFRHMCGSHKARNWGVSLKSMEP